MIKSHPESSHSTSREQAENKIDRLILRTKLAPYVATLGIFGAAFFGASGDNEALQEISLGSGIAAMGVLLGERKLTEHQIESTVDHYSEQQGSFSTNTRTELSINEDGELTETSRLDDVAWGLYYHIEHSGIGGFLNSAIATVGTPTAGHLIGRTASGKILPGAEAPVLTIGGAMTVAAGIGVAGLHRSANKLQESSHAQLNNIDGGMSFEIPEDK